ncbi:MAG: hypothetical protein C5B52_03385 [Bacteroidetes bacterium]|nr:MAG: hypothetical protein C5B52_03385 [Bacteroidota bacterium]
MKRLLWMGFLMLTGSALFAQTSPSTVLAVKTGTVLDYEVNVNGQLVPLTMKIFLPAEGGLGFDFEAGDVYGKFINSKEGLESASSTNWETPPAGEEKKLGSDQTTAVFSRSFLKDLIQNKKAQYDGQSWTLKDVPAGSEFSLDNKSKLDFVYVESDSAATKFWILNNKDYPIILKVEGNKKGPDLILKAIH